MRRARPKSADWTQSSGASIPASIFAHYYEGRIQGLFHQIDELLFNLLPQIERFENRTRFARHHAESSEGATEPAPEPPPVAKS